MKIFAPNAKTSLLRKVLFLVLERRKDRRELLCLSRNDAGIKLFKHNWR